MLDRIGCSYMSIQYISTMKRHEADQSGKRAVDYEDEHVHKVYSAISLHFSKTRYKPWPVVERFLQDQPQGAIGLDVGAGNGKYLAVNPDVFIIATDRSEELVKIASRHSGSSAAVADSLALPHPNGRFDFAISIAVVHHFSSPQRRVEALRAMLAALRSRDDSSTSGTALVFVWALEQKGSRRGWSEEDEQDVMVPWVLKDTGADERTYHRYYHLYRKGELEQDIVKAGGQVLESGYDRDNWWAVASR
jgi:tRNA (uracil-5-)-methyltransferase TRM9